MGDANTQPQQRERNEIEKGGNDVIQSYVGRHSDKHTTARFRRVRAVLFIVQGTGRGASR